MSLRPTIYDIARQANVSIATVSRVFNGSTRVSDRTRSRVLKIAQELNYQPHVSARSLASRRSDLVMAVIPMLTNYFYMEVVRGVQDALLDSEWDLLVYTAQAPEKVDTQLARALQRGRAEGVLLFSTPLTKARIAKMKQADLPVVLVDSHHPDFDAISVDNEQGGFIATQHLLEQGYRRIGLITGHKASVPALDRQMGYRRALQTAGLSVNEAHILVSEDLHQHGYTEMAGYTAMETLLQQADPPDAVFVASDIQALGALRAIREHGLQTPNDIGVVGFDDIQFSIYVGLSTLHQPMYDMGKQAIQRLIQRIEDPSRPVAHTQFAPKLVVRETSTLSRTD